jgi:hypothetical protein
MMVMTIKVVVNDLGAGIGWYGRGSGWTYLLAVDYYSLLSLVLGRQD